MSLMNELEELGVNVNEALERFMNNSGLYTKMLKKFASSIPQYNVVQYLENGEYEKALDNAHSLKGVTGNLSITPLYKAYSEIVALLRNNDPEKAGDIIRNVIPVQEQIVSCIEKNT